MIRKELDMLLGRDDSGNHFLQYTITHTNHSRASKDDLAKIRKELDMLLI